MPLSFAIPLLLGILAAVGVVCLGRIGRDRAASGAVGRGAALMIWFVYLGFTALTSWVAWEGVWALPLARDAAVAGGGVILLIGLGVMAAGMAEFGSMRKMIGRECSGLVRSGIYSWTRNPQNLGWSLCLTGAAVMGRSGLALVFAGVFAVAFRLYVPVEERYLERMFGEEWRDYERSVSRFVPLPRALRAVFSERPATRDTSRRFLENHAGWKQ